MAEGGMGKRVHSVYRDLGARFIPKEIQSLDASKIAMYIKAINEGTEKHTRIRVMTIGHYGVGKTSLVRNLLTLPLSGTESTDGIEVHKSTISVDGFWAKNTNKTPKSRMASVAFSFLQEKQNTSETNTHTESSIERSCEDEDFDTGQLTSNLTTSFDKDLNANKGKPVDIDTIPEEYLQEFAGLLEVPTGAKGTDTRLEKIVNVWDFAGQYIYYATHQLFLSQQAVYLLIVDVSNNLDNPIPDEDFPDGSNLKDVKSFCQFWMHSIHAFVGTVKGVPPVIIVGTHKDKMDTHETLKDKEAGEYFDRIRHMFKGTPVLDHIQGEDFLLDNLQGNTGGSLSRLRKYIVGVAEKQNTWSMDLPAKWIPFEEALMKGTKKHMTVDEVCRIDASSMFPIGDTDQIKLCLTYHHQMGSIVYFDERYLNEFVVLDPQWIIDAFKCIITSKRFCNARPDLIMLREKLVKDAILEHRLIDAVWTNDIKNDFMENKKILLMYLEQLSIVSKAKLFDVDTQEHRELDYYIVPSLLKCQSCTNGVGEFVKSRQSTTITLVFAFKNCFVSPVVYHHTTAAALGTWKIVRSQGTNLLFENVGVYYLDRTHAGIISATDKTIEIRVVNLCGEDIDNRQCDRLRRFVEMVLTHEFDRYHTERESQYKLCIRCPKSACGLSFKDIEELKKLPISSCPDEVHGHEFKVSTALAQWFPDHETNEEIKTDWLSKYLSSGNLSRQPTSKELSRLAQVIGHGWELLGISLGLNKPTIDQIKMDNPNMSALQIFTMLSIWVRQDPDSAQLDVLLQEINDNQAVSVNWDRIKNMLDNFPR